MPNWCESDLTVTGQDVQKVLDYVASGDSVLDFNKIIPYPAKFKELDARAEEYGKKVSAIYDKELSEQETEKKLIALDVEYNAPVTDGYNQGGYQWCNRNWGTKWNACNPRISSQSKKRAMIKFETPWAPPVPVIAVLAEKFPEFTFTMKYYERGMEFQGTLKFENGKLVLVKNNPYHGKRGG